MIGSRKRLPASKLFRELLPKIYADRKKIMIKGPLQVLFQNRKENDDKKSKTVCNEMMHRFWVISASLTVEAALVLPLFLLAMLCLLQLFSLQLFQIRLQQAMDAAVQKASAYYYLVNAAAADEESKQQLDESGKIERSLLEQGITAAYLQYAVSSELSDDWFSSSMIRDRKGGLNLLRSSFPDEEGNLDLVLSYWFDFPFFPGNLADIALVQRSCRKVWTGTLVTRETEDEPIVYLTENASVYHTNRNCTHLKLSIQEVLCPEASKLKNKYGRTYTPCERCTKNMPAPIYAYITSEGERYHYNVNCSGLTRSVRAVKLSEVGDLNCCSRCQANAGQ